MEITDEHTSIQINHSLREGTAKHFDVLYGWVDELDSHTHPQTLIRKNEFVI
jgi:hypothetical protein